MAVSMSAALAAPSSQASTANRGSYPNAVHTDRVTASFTSCPTRSISANGPIRNPALSRERPLHDQRGLHAQFDPADLAGGRGGELGDEDDPAGPLERRQA